MNYRFEHRLYQRLFRQPLQTSHGIWEVREGIIIRVTDEIGKVGCGEIAPLPWFGSETLGQALKFCQQLQGKISAEEIDIIPGEFPACQFGFESAVEDLSRTENEETQRIAYSYLLPAGDAALEAWKKIVNQKQISRRGGFSDHNRSKQHDNYQNPPSLEEVEKVQKIDRISPMTFKWKIGVGTVEEEIDIFKRLARSLPKETRLRLDANGGLSVEDAKIWLEVAEKTEIVEFIEQPLSPQEFDRTLVLSNNYSTPIALDESVATLQQLADCYQKGWRGIYVIKAAIAGSPKRLHKLCRQYDLDAVFSSVFETQIGRKAVLRIAKELSHRDRAVGFGVNHWFAEDD
jgi:o-succinylbenzoate synthase